MDPHTQHEHTHEHGGCHSTIIDELVCHFPYAVFSVAVALACLAFTTYGSGSEVTEAAQWQAGALFHCFHFMHILFAVSGTLITFMRNSRNIPVAIVVGIISPTFFCVISDAVLPYLAGRMMGVDMHFHLCFVSELRNVLPFLVVGVINGFVIASQHKRQQPFYSVFSHVLHIFVSSLASTFYLVSHGFTDVLSSVGVVFLFLVIAVVVPCTISDIVVPMALARVSRRNEKHKA